MVVIWALLLLKVDEEERFLTVNCIVKQQTGIDIHALAGSPPIKLQRPRSTEEAKIFLSALKELLSTCRTTLLPIYKKLGTVKN